MPKHDPHESTLVLVADDNEAIRESVEALLHSVGLSTAAFANGDDLLLSGLVDRANCLIIDVRMPGTSGLELQRKLAALAIHKPIVFITAFGDIAMSVEAMKAGAFDFLEKPFREQELLDAVHAAIAREATMRADAIVRADAVSKFKTLTPRESQVMREVARGQLNKQVADTLGISEITVKLHRGNVMRKMNAATIGELIRTWEALPPDFREVDDASQLAGLQRGEPNVFHWAMTKAG